MVVADMAWTSLSFRKACQAPDSAEIVRASADSRAPGCHYKWYSTREICMILERFDGVVFVGDELIAQLYASFNILLRRNLAMGGMEQWRMSDKERETCRCGNQFVKQECSKFFVTSNEQVALHDSEGGVRSPYVCNRELSLGPACIRALSQAS